MTYETSFPQDPDRNREDTTDSSRRRRVARLCATTVGAALAGMLTFGGAQNSTDQPHNPNAGSYVGDQDGKQLGMVDVPSAEEVVAPELYVPSSTEFGPEDVLISKY